jgi:hypothetical protein
MMIQERDYLILLWLLYHPFSKLEQMKHLFECRNPHRAPYRRLLKLVKEGLVETVWIATEPQQLYLATRKAVALLRSVGFQYVPGVVKEKRPKNFEHDNRLIDLRLFFEELKIGIWVPERVIRSIKPRGNSPDAIILTGEPRYAIEYERTAKEPQRYRKIFERYAEKEKYDAVLYILPTEARIDKLQERVSYIPKKIYFISEEKLFQEKGNATFFSSSDGLPMKQLIYWSRGGSVEDLEPKELKEAIQFEEPDAWKDRKPFWGGGGGKKKQESYESDEFHGGSGFDPQSYPNMYPGEEDNDQD